jgi:hypothetical protein
MLSIICLFRFFLKFRESEPEALQFFHSPLVLLLSLNYVKFELFLNSYLKLYLFKLSILKLFFFFSHLYILSLIFSLFSSQYMWKNCLNSEYGILRVTI